MSLTLLKSVSLIFALIGIVSIILLMLNRILQPQDVREVFLNKVSWVCLVLLLVAMTLTLLGPARIGLALSPQMWAVSLLGMSLIIAFIPHLAVRMNWHYEASERESAKESFLRSFQSQMDSTRNEIERRALEKRPFTAAEALRFLVALSQWDLRYRGLLNYSPQAESVLKRAIELRVLDPNARDEENNPVFLSYYSPILDLANSAHTGVRSSDFAIIKVLLENGADTSLRDKSGRIIKDYLNLEPNIWE